MRRYGEEDVFDIGTATVQENGRTFERKSFWFETSRGELSLDEEIIVYGRRCVVHEISEGAANGIDAVCAIEGPTVEEKLDAANQ